ncbi:hypothetical protein L198_00532 [Cryptococcus wingfieldii CBS 7118]|uniref:Uncharacterized protein n=1 Tax=Cryptococcus wingfieldii CBS 7118 TaxID=1295528 RepID=A0A1E3K6T8_9TREE|nr:hypothetical protein L198_00532 [Cryptococcus wingfieldii CBS 7118]ODO08799.1 hypothetical protein L198_00532 [Cryptococcus wingfieldii CBS 7118]
MPGDLSFLDQLEDWLEAQIPNNIHHLPHKMYDTVEKMTGELLDSLNIHGPPSISIPFPPFGGKDAPPPPPPPSSAVSCAHSVADRSGRVLKNHPYAVGAALSVGLGLTGLMVYKGVGVFGNDWRIKRRFGVRGAVEDGMLKEAIVILAPSPLPPLLVPLAASLLRSGYIVLVAVTNNRDAQSLERRLSSLEERAALRVLIYDPDDSTTFPPFHRSLLATLTLRFPVTGKYAAGDPYNPQPTQLAHIHAFLSLYPLHPDPPSQPGALPAMPTLVAPNANGSLPLLVNFYPSGSVPTTPNTFASQVLTSNHLLLGKNLAASSPGARVVSVYVGDIDLPTLPAILSHGKTLTRRQLAKERLAQDSTPKQKVSVIGDYLFGTLRAVFGTIIGTVGLGSTVREYATFEKSILRIIKSSYGHDHFVGQRSMFPLLLSQLPIPGYLLPSLLTYLPSLPSPTGPPLPDHPKATRSKHAARPASRDADSERESEKTSAEEGSEHESTGEDLVSSIHTGTSLGSERGMDSESSEGAGSSGLEGSWVGLDSAK